MCEPFNRYKHGYDNNSSANIQEYQIVYDTYSSFNGIIAGAYYLKNRRERHMRIFGSELNAKIHLIEPHVLESGELVAIIKTMWISILQRTWRRIYYERKRKITKYLQLKNLQKREIGIN
jgi:hypothetical protein